MSWLFCKISCTMLCIEYLKWRLSKWETTQSKSSGLGPKNVTVWHCKGQRRASVLAGMEDALGEQPGTHDLSLATPQSWALTSAENQWEAGIY